MTKNRKKSQSAKGQSTLELSVGIFLMLLLLLAIARVFVWLNLRLVLRQEDYEARRVEAASVNPDSAYEVQVNESGHPPLRIFENWKRLRP